MNIIQKEFMIVISTLLLCYVSHKLDSYNVMTIFLLVRIWLEMRCDD